MPKSGTGQIPLVIATASKINSLDKIGPSFLNAEQIHAPAQACLTYSAKGQELTQKASLFLVSRTMHLPGGTN